jgi:hypothetical protein
VEDAWILLWLLKVLKNRILVADEAGDGALVRLSGLTIPASKVVKGASRSMIMKQAQQKTGVT